MSNKKNIVFKSVEEYNKKFRNGRHNLLSISKSEVEQFDKKYSTNKKDYLLEGRKWTLIGERYYEIPKAPRLVWFRNLNTSVKIITSVLLTGGTVSAVTIPTLMFTVWNKGSNPVKEWYEDRSFIDGLKDSDVGLEKELLVNGQIHKVRLIGVNHDKFEDNTDAHTTWEFANLISDSDGYSLAYQWNDTNDEDTANHDYTSSSIRKVLCGSGNWDLTNHSVYCATKSSAHDTKTPANNHWDSSYTYTSSNNKTILSMLPDKLQNVLKPVKKTVRVNTDSQGYTKVEDCSDKLFMLSNKEIGGTENLDEGTVYKYYEGEKEDIKAKRRKQQVKGSENALTQNAKIDYKPSTTIYSYRISSYGGYNNNGDPEFGGSYWLRSPYTYSKVDAYYCAHSGVFSLGCVYDDAYGVAPAFCL